jgi:hypothetical protein
VNHPIRISVRAAPAVVAWHAPTIEDGVLWAEVRVSHSNFRFPCPFDENGDLTKGCRTWIVEAVRSAIQRDGLKRWITWPDLAVTSFAGVDLVAHDREIPKSPE